MTPRIFENDLLTKVNKIKKLLIRYPVRVDVIFRGREVTHPEFGIAVLKKIIEETKNVAKIEASSLVPNKKNMYFIILRGLNKV